MPRLALILTLIFVGALALAACGGGGEEPVEVVSIRPVDFEGVELTMADSFDPPFVDHYPDVVAEVNGEPITGRQLVQVQAATELGLRETSTLQSRFLQSEYLEQAEGTDPLEKLIDDLLLRQAVERLDLLPPYETAVGFTSTQEANFLHPRGTIEPENRAEVQELLDLQGYPAEDWASNPDVVEGYRQGLGLGALRGRECTPTTPIITGINLVSTGPDCSEFLAHERQNADIVYYVRWVD
ncbi:MAG: hypothetical protein WD939_10440 [Dehalococcoidia bacterium]